MLFKSALRLLGTSEQYAEYERAIDQLDVFGCFAMVSFVACPMSSIEVQLFLRIDRTGT
jgi:hypothetical protein